MTDNDINDSNSFIRQRRNLIVVCLILFFYKYGQADITGELNAFGVKVSLDNDQAIINLLWIAWAYFLIRYYQYLQAISSEKRFKAKLKQIWSGRQGEVGRIRGLPLVPEEYKKNFTKTGIRKTGTGKYEIYIEYNVPGIDVVEGMETKTDVVTAPIFAVTVFSCYLLSIARTSIIYSSFTEYNLPYLIAAFVFLYWLIA